MEEAMPTWDQISTPLYGIAGLVLIFATAFGQVDPGIALATFGTGLALCGYSGAKFVDARIKDKQGGS